MVSPIYFHHRKRHKMQKMKSNFSIQRFFSNFAR